MTLPFLSINVVEGGAGSLTSAQNRALVIGPATGKTPLDGIYTFGNINKVAPELGYGPAQTATELIMSMAPTGYALVDVVVAAASDSSGAGIVQEKAGGGAPDIDVTGTPNNDYDLGIEITKAGNLGEARFRYTLDGGYSWSFDNKVPASGTFVIPNTGLSVEFEPAQTLGNSNYSIVTANKMTAQDVSDALNYLAQNSNRSYSVILIADERRTPDVSIFNAVNTAFDAFNSQYRLHTVGVLPIGGENKVLNAIPNNKTAVSAASVISAYDAVNQNTGNFICAVAERARITLPLPRPGYTAPALPFGYAVAGEVHGVGGDISKNPAESTVRRVDSISYDEFLDGSVYNDERIVAPRTFRGESGYFLNQGSLFADAQSSYYLVPHGRVINRAREALYLALRPYLNSRVVIGPTGGKIDEKEKIRIEADVNSQLADSLMSGINGAGGRGHVSAVNFTLDGDNNLLQTGELIGVCEIVAFGYPSQINVTLALVNETINDIALG